MPNLNYAEQWSPELLAILMQGTLTSPFITSNVRWLDAKTFHFTQMSVSVIRITRDQADGTQENITRKMFLTQ